MASYDTTPEQFTQMQRDALDRLREMQRRSRSYINPPPQGEPLGVPPPIQEPPPTAPPPMPAPNQGGGSLLSGVNVNVNDIFKNILGDGLKLDSEKALILMMLFVLYKNKADIKLLLALGYLLL